MMLNGLNMIINAFVLQSGLTHTSAEEKMEINVTWTSPAYPFEGDVTLW